MTMELDEDALPLHEDATFKLRPRLFLEGNYFVDLHPGSPNAPETSEDHTFPINQTSYSVQLDQVLTTLQGDVRDRPPDVPQPARQRARQGRRRRRASTSSTAPRRPACKYTSQVNEALLGTPARRPRGRDPRARPRRPRARAQRGHASEPGHQLPHLLRLVRRRGPGAGPGDRGAAEHARGGPAGVREPERRLPAAPRVRARGAARRALDARRRSARRRRSSSRFARWSPSPSCAA